jgi:preprotein translocase subunit YajC
MHLPNARVALNYPAIFIMHLNSFLAQASAPAQTASGTQPTPAQSLFSSPLILIVLMVVMMYFLIFRPQQQRAKQQAKLISSLKSGDKVVTSSGIIGVVITVKDKTVSIRSADAKFEITKSSVTEILESSDAAQSSP